MSGGHPLTGTLERRHAAVRTVHVLASEPAVLIPRLCLKLPAWRKIRLVSRWIPPSPIGGPLLLRQADLGTPIVMQPHNEIAGRVCRGNE